MRSDRTVRPWLLRLSLAGLAMLLLVETAQAGGPRWSSGKPYFTNQNGISVVWFTNHPLYYTDPGDLSGSVNHTAADALVAAAAATWNVSTASLVLAQGGSLDEHVSGLNVYLGSNGPVFPADVQLSNSASKQIAVIYDSDGSVTDTLLGGGASDPGNCTQNAVTEDVDGISVASQITHAVLVLNGRCTGIDPALQLQMQYSLTRAFGRVLGMGWSQVNDNVFTGASIATNGQMLHWPLMHPMEVFCTAYAYQCVLQPFTLKVDDVLTLQALYPVNTAGGGKTVTSSTGAYLNGVLSFPTGQGMAGVNLLLRRSFLSTQVTDDYELASSVSGANFQRVGGNPVVAKGTDLLSSIGSPYASSGGYSFGYIPFLPSDNWVRLFITGEAVNPLYTGQYAVGPYQSAQVIPSGAISSSVDAVSTRVDTLNFLASGAATGCGTLADGTEGTPASVPSTGWWTGTMCAYGHTAWSSLQVKAGRSFAIEVTSVDEQGYATAGKLQPVIGVWASTDPTQVAPTVASQASSLNAGTLGETTLGVTNATARGLRIGLGDARGDGRPDYGYKARILYAAAIAPVSLPANGGQVTITGMGFRSGNTVTVNGIAANVLNWTATTIVAVAPPITGPLTVDVVVTDITTGGQTTMTAALTYSGATLPDTLAVVSVPANGSVAGSAALQPFSVQVLLPDGITPAVGGSATFGSTNATLGACAGLSGCILTADASGLVTTTVTPLAAGTVTLGAMLGSASVSASFTTTISAADQLRVVTLPSGTVYTGVPAGTPFSVQVLMPDGVTPASGVQVALAASGASLATCGAASCVVAADTMGIVSTIVTPAIGGTIGLTASAGGGIVSASFGALAMPSDVLRVASAPANGAYVGQTSASPFSVQVMLGDGVTPAAGVIVTLTTAGASLGACGASPCGLTTDGAGMISTAVTPTSVGTVMLAATAGGRSVSTSFQAATLPPDVLRLASLPANGSYVGSAAAQPFSVQVLLGDGATPAAGVSVTLTASGAFLGACGAAQCVLVANAQGMASTTITPTVSGVIRLTAAAVGLSLSPSFSAISDAVHLLAVPSGYIYVGVPTQSSFAVQVTLADQATAVPGAVVVVTASKAIVNACGLSTCVMTADVTGTITTTLTPTQPGAISLQATSGGGSLQTSFAALGMPADVLKIVSKPTGLLYPQILDATPVEIQVLLGDGRTPAPGVAVRLYSENLSLGPCVGVCNANHACGGACLAISDSNGIISVPVMGLTVGPAVFTANLGNTIDDLPFTVVAMPPSTLRVVSSPPDGSLVGRPAGASFGVQLLRGGGVPIGGVATTLTATGATLGVCGQTSCTLSGDTSGTVSTAVTPTLAGTVHLTATSGGATSSVTFLALASPPDTIRVVAVPANGSYVGRVAAIRFEAQVLLSNGTAAGIGIPVTLTASGATLGACGSSACIVNTDVSGDVATTVSPLAAGMVGLTANGGGGTISTTFVAVAAPPDLLTVLSVPANDSYVGLAATAAFSVQVKLSDGVTVAAGVPVTLTAAGGTLRCGLPICVLTADETGTVSSTVTATAAGTVVLSAAAGGGLASATFTARSLPTDTLRVMSVPADSALVNRAAAEPFTVQVLTTVGNPVAAGIPVTLTAAGATFGVCGMATCSLRTDVAGRVSTTVTPTSVGTVMLAARAGGGTISASFTVVAAAPPPDRLRVVSAPAAGSYVGEAAAAPFEVQVMPGDGVSPTVGTCVTVSASGATFGACGLAACEMTADANGRVATSVVPTAAGAVTLAAAAGGGSISSSFIAQDPVRVIAVTQAVEYVAVGSTVAWSPGVTVFQNGSPAVGVGVNWTVSGSGLALAGSTSTVEGDGTASMNAAIGPLAAGATVTGEACSWTTACAGFSAVAVDAQEWRLFVTSGGAQSVVAGEVLQPVTVEVVDTAGHPVAGAPVTVHQAVEGWVVCPAEGRCPSVPVLATSTGTLVSDRNGLLTVTPLETAGVPGVTQVFVVAGPYGAASASLSKSP